MKKTAVERLLWIIPIAVGAMIFGAAVVRGESLFLRVAWDPNNVLSFFPWNIFSASEFASGRFPLWNPHNACGVPHLANFQSAPFYPLHLLLFVHPSAGWFDIFYLTRFAILAIGVWLLARRLGMSSTAAIASVTAATFGGYFVAYGSMVHINVEVLFPWALWLVTRQELQFKLHDLLGLIFVFALACLGGNPESAFYLIGLTILWAVWLEFAESKWLVLPTVFAAVAAFLIAAPQLAPFFEYFPKAWHIHAIGAGDQYLNPNGMYSILFAVGGQNGGSYVPYFGAAVLLLAIIGANKDKRSCFFLTASIFVLGMTYGAPVFKWATKLPFLSRAASYKYALAPLAVMIALLAGYGVEKIARGEATGGRVRRAAGYLTVFAVMFPIGAWIEGRQFNVTAAIIAIAVLCAVSIAASSLGKKSAVVIAVVLAVELVINAYGLNLSTILDPVKFSDRPEIKYLADNRADGRTAVRAEYFPPNLNLVAGFDDVNSFDALYPRGYVKYISKALNFDESNDVSYFKSHGYSFPIEPDSVNSSVWRELGVRYYLGDDLRRDWMKPVVGKLYEDEQAPNILSADGAAAQWAINDNQEMIWRGGAPVSSLRWRATRTPGWRAWADGVEVPVKEWLGLFMEINTVSPAKEIRLRYMPYGWRVGLWTGIGSLLSLILVVWSRGRRLRGGA